jgi:predicted phage replisome organizer
MADVKYIQIVTDIFENNKIVEIESMPKGDTILIIWFRLLTLAGSINEDGLLKFAENIPYDVKKLANKFKRNEKILQKSLEIFKNFSMIDIVNVNGKDYFHISNWAKYQNVESLAKIRENNRLRVQKYRSKKKNSNVTGNVTVTLQDTLLSHRCNALDKDIDKDIDIEEDIERDKEKDYKDNKINLINDKSDKALRVDCHPLTLELIKRNYITEHDLDIPSYNVLFDAMSNKYPKEQLYTTISYIVSKSRGKQIDNKYAYFETALIKGLNRKQLEYKANGEVEVY